MNIAAKTKYIRMSPRKVRLVIDLIRGMAVEDALAQLRFLRKDAALPVGKLIESAAANAVHNFKSEKGNLYIKKITADGGPTLHRWHPRARGSAAPIRKRTCHIMVVLDEIRSEKAQVVKKAKKIQELKPIKSKIEEKTKKIKSAKPRSISTKTKDQKPKKVSVKPETISGDQKLKRRKV